METFSSLLAICAGNSPVTVESPANRPVTRSFDIFFICARINVWANNRDAGDLRPHHAHYYVIVIVSYYMYMVFWINYKAFLLYRCIQTFIIEFLCSRCKEFFIQILMENVILGHRDENQGSLWLIWLPLFTAWISNCIHNKAWGGITNPFPNFNSAAVEVWEWSINFVPHFLCTVSLIFTYLCWDNN